MPVRTAIQEFSTSNKIYVNATVTFYTVSNGAKTTTKADLYAATIGDTKLANPQTLDSYGKFKQPVYAEEAVVAVISGLGNTPDHETGIIYGPQAANDVADAVAAAEGFRDEAETFKDQAGVYAQAASDDADAAAASEANASTSETNAGNSEAASAASASLAEDWAVKMDGPVSGGEYSAKYHATASGVSAAAALVSEGNASDSEDAAALSEANAAASEIAAAASASKLFGTSTSSVAVGASSKSFTTQADKFFTPGTFLMVTSDAAPSTNYMFGQVTSYSGTALELNVLAFAGSGTYADWTITISGARGEAGAGAEADNVSYDNATSGLTAVTVQDAIDEVEGRVDSVEGAVAGLGTMSAQDADSVAITGGTIGGLDSPLALADGGLGATTAAGGRGALGLANSSTTDNALVRFDGTTGQTQNSGVVVSDANEISGYAANINAQTGTTYTLQASDMGKVVTLTNASAITVTLPNSLQAGFNCTCIQDGAGQVTFSAAGGATLHNRLSQSKTAGQRAAVGLIVKSNSGGSSAIYNLSGDTGA